jgi:cytochrome P450
VLTWTLYLLSQHPEVTKRIQAEVRTAETLRMSGTYFQTAFKFVRNTTPLSCLALSC